MWYKNGALAIGEADRYKDSMRMSCPNTAMAQIERSFKIASYKQEGKNLLKNYGQEEMVVSKLASVSAACSSFAQSFVQVGLDGIQEVWRVHIMFIQLAAAKSRAQGLLFLVDDYECD